MPLFNIREDNCYNFTIVDDDIDEDDESFTVGIDISSNIGLNINIKVDPNSTEITIIDDTDDGKAIIILSHLRALSGGEGSIYYFSGWLSSGHRQILK